MQTNTNGYCFFNEQAPTEIYTLSLHDALPISFSESTFWLDLSRSSCSDLASSASSSPSRFIFSKFDFRSCCFCFFVSGGPGSSPGGGRCSCCEVGGEAGNWYPISAEGKASSGCRQPKPEAKGSRQNKPRVKVSSACRYPKAGPQADRAGGRQRDSLLSRPTRVSRQQSDSTIITPLTVPLATRTSTGFTSFA